MSVHAKDGGIPTSDAYNTTAISRVIMRLTEMASSAVNYSWSWVAAKYLDKMMSMELESSI